MLRFVVPCLKRPVIALLLLMVFCPASVVLGSGFAVFTHGASALGQGNAVTAHADDPTAIFYNPALINKLEGAQVEVGTTLIYPQKEFTDSSGNSFDTKKTINYPATFYATYKFSDKISAGLGVFSPFGLSSEWGNSWPGKYITTKSEMQTFDINPVVSVQVTPYLALAAGVDVLLLDATLESIHATGATVKFEGDGTGIGYNFGALLDLGKDFSLGASYRSQIKVTIKGDSSTNSTIPPLMAALNGSGETDLTLPQQITAGVAYKGINRLTVEAGLRWEGWSSFEKLQLQVNGSSLPATQRNWKNVFGFNAGAKYKLNDTFSLLAGYLYGNSPVPDNTFDPTIPDSDTHVFSVGTDMDYKKFKVALAYAYQLFEGRTKSNSIDPPASNGKYESDAHLLALSFVYRF